MAHQGITTELPCGLAGMMQRANRLHSGPGELYDSDGVTLEDSGVRKEAGAIQLDAVGLPSAPSIAATWASSVTWGGHLMTMKGPGTPAHVGNVGKANFAATSTVNIVVPVAGVAATHTVVVMLGSGIFPGTTPLPIASDNKGNLYIRVQRTIGSGAFSRQIVTWFATITTPLVSGDTITVNLGFNTTGGIIASEFSSLFDDPVDRTATANGTGTAVLLGPTAPLTQTPQVIIGALYGVGASSAITAGSGATVSAQDTGFSGDIVPQNTALLFRVDTSTPTITSALDWNPNITFNVTPGTGSTTRGSTTVTGSGTSFSTLINAGDLVRIAGETHRVASVTSNTVLNTVDPWAVTNAGATITVVNEQALTLATSAGDIYTEWNGNLDAFLNKSGLSRDSRPGKFLVAGKETAAAGRKPFYFSGGDAVQVITSPAASATALATPPADWSGSNQPVNGIVHNFRLCGFGNLNDPHRLYCSSPSNHENFTATDAFQLSIRSSIGDRLYGAAQSNGLLFLWKYPRGIFYIDDSDISYVNFRERTVSEVLGCAPSPYAVLPIDNDVLFMAADGRFHLLSAVDSLGGVRASDLSYKLDIAKWLRDNVNLARLDLVTSTWYAHKKIAEFGVPGTGDVTPTLRLRFDFGLVDDGGPVRFGYSTRDNPTALALRRDITDRVSRPIICEAGFVYLTEQAARNKAGFAYTSTYQTPHLDMRHVDAAMAFRRKNFDALELVFEPVSAGTVTVQPYVDGLARGAALTFDATKRAERKQLNVGAGRTISFRGSNGTLNEDFNILAHRLSFRSSDEAQGV